MSSVCVILRISSARWNDPFLKPPEDSCPLPLLASPAVLSAAGVFGLKKPFKLCCPFPVVVACADVDTDLERLRGRLVEVSPRDRLLLVLFAGLAGGAGEAGLGEDCGGRACAVARDDATRRSTASCNIVEGGSAASADGVSLSSSRDGDSVLGAVVTEGLRENMSLMFLRRSNSGISLPDSGWRSFIEYFRNRLPSLNMPTGFITSRTSTSSPFSEILSFRTA